MYIVAPRSKSATSFQRLIRYDIRIGRCCMLKVFVFSYAICVSRKGKRLLSWLCLGLSGEGASPTVNVYLWEERHRYVVKPRPAIIFCPGGAYSRVAKREGEPVALRFLAMGFQCFILRYTTLSMPFPAALAELSETVRMVRQKAGEWNIDPDRIVVCGFSAGGHLAASLGVFWNAEFLRRPLGYTGRENRPDGLILAYPVITSGQFAHEESFKNLLGDSYTEKLSLVSLEKQVTEDTPPAFLWHTFEDEAVPPENALLFAMSMRQKGVSTELHLWPHGCHGLALADDETERTAEGCVDWPAMAARWIRHLPGNGGRT